MFLLSTLNCWNFIEHTFWPSKPRLPKFLQRDSWAWTISRRWDDIPWVLLSFCVNMGFCWRSHFPWVWERSMDHELWFITWARSIFWCWWCCGGYDPNWWRGNVDHESASWSKDLVGHVSPIHVVEWNMSLFWALKRFTQKSIICWCGVSCQ